MTMRLHCYIAALFATVLAAPQIYAPSPARADIFPPPGMAPNAANAVLPTAKGNLHLPLNVDDFGAIGDGNSHPLSGFFANQAAAAARCPSLLFLTGANRTGNTNSSASLTSLTNLVPYVISGMTITDSLGDIPASTTVTAVNYSTGALTISHTATGTHTGDVFTIGFGVSWATVEMDWCAADGAIWAARNYVANGNGLQSYPPVAFGVFKNYVMNYPPNLTCIGSFAPGCPSSNGPQGTLEVYGNGSIINLANSTDASGAALDLLGANQITIHALSVTATGTGYKRGVQFGKTVYSLNALEIVFDDVTIYGNFSQAPFYNLASEQAVTNNSGFSNINTSGNAFQGIWDAGNYWLATSDYTSETIPQYTLSPFGHDLDFNGFFQGSGTGGGLWIYGTFAQQLKNTYILTGGTGPCITLFNDGSTVPFNLAADLTLDNVNCEGASSASAISVVSKTAAATPTLLGLNAKFTGGFATNVFALGTNTSSLTLANPAVAISYLSMTPNFFDTPASYTVRGANIRLPTGFAGDNIASGWTGYKCVGLLCANGGISSGTNAGAGAVGEVMATGGGAANGTVTMTIASPAVISDAGACPSLTNPNGCVSPGSVINLTTTGALPTGTVVGTNYYVIATNFVAGTSYEISTTPFGTAVVTSGSQSGVQTRVNTAITTTTAVFNGAAIKLTAGDWDCGGVSTFTATGTHTRAASWFGPTSAGVGLAQSEYAADFTGGTTIVANSPTQANISTPTIYYLTGTETFSTGAGAFTGQIQCRRRS